MNLKKQYQSFEGFFFDCDGVIWEDNSLLAGAKELVEFLSNSEIKTCFLSNNSTKSLDQYVSKFTTLGLEVNKDQVMISSVVTLAYIERKNYPSKSIFIIGEDGLKKTFEDAGYYIASDDTEEENIDAVIVGMDRSFNYKKLSLALKYCLKGSDFIGTNPDPQFPTTKGFFPGAGSMIGALEGALKYPPEKICGKPDPLMAQLMTERFNLSPKKVVMIGDRVTTDLQFALNAGLTPVLVKTGFGQEEYSNFVDFPYFQVIETLEELLE